MNAIDHILAVANAFADARQLSESRVSTLIFGEGTRLKHLRTGGDMGARRVARGLEWLSANWPEGKDWPEDVPRPPQPASAARHTHYPADAAASGGKEAAASTGVTR